MRMVYNINFCELQVWRGTNILTISTLNICGWSVALLQVTITLKYFLVLEVGFWLPILSAAGCLWAGVWRFVWMWSVWVVQVDMDDASYCQLY